MLRSSDGKLLIKPQYIQTEVLRRKQHLWRTVGCYSFLLDQAYRAGKARKADGLLHQSKGLEKITTATSMWQKSQPPNTSLLGACRGGQQLQRGQSEGTVSWKWLLLTWESPEHHLPKKQSLLVLGVFFFLRERLPSHIPQIFLRV